jgi:hypothetical protein
MRPSGSDYFTTESFDGVFIFGGVRELTSFANRVGAFRLRATLIGPLAGICRRILHGGRFFSAKTPDLKSAVPNRQELLAVAVEQEPL